MLINAVTLPIWGKISDLFAYGTQENSLGQLITNLIDLILIVAIIIALIFLLVGAINWITGEGKPDKLEGARNTVIHAIVGLVIAVAAYVLWLVVVKDFLGIDIQTGINISGPPGTGTTPAAPGPGGGGTPGGFTCTIGAPDVSDGGAGNYCAGPGGGATLMRCCGGGTYGGVYYGYTHLEPVGCVSTLDSPRFGFSSTPC